MTHSYVVSGAAGFIGSNVCHLLLQAGHTVLGIDNLNDAYDVRLKEWRLRALSAEPRFQLSRFDIGDRAAVEAFFAGLSTAPAAVINLAARAGVRQSVENPWVYVDTNLTGTLNLLEACRARQIKKFVLASTSSLYGQNLPMPYREDQSTDRPISPYAASKKAAEAMCHTYHHLFGVDVSVLRYFTVYGPGGRPDMSLFRFVQWVFEERPVTIFGDGTQSRDFTYVEDIARGTIAALKPVGYEIINLGSDQPVVLLEMLKLVESLVGKKAKLDFKPRHAADVMSTWADISKAKHLLGWSANVTYQQGVERLVGWYRENRAWAKDIATE